MASEYHPERGAIKPGWMALAVLACAIAGTTINQCLICGPDDASAKKISVAGLQGAPIDAPLLTIEPRHDPEPEPAKQAGPEPGIAPAERDVPQPLPKLGQKDPKESGPAEGGAEGPVYLAINFDKLSDWTYHFPEIGNPEPRQDPIPDRIRKLTGEKVSIQGFMIPVKLAGEDEVVEFLLVRDQFACCFGQIPKMNEWLHIKMAPGRASRYLTEIPVTVRGTFDAAELIENGVVMSLYRMEAWEVLEPKLFR